MNFAGEAGARSPRVSFTALRTGETYYMPFVPEQFGEEVKASYSKLTVSGMSHQVFQYSHTENHGFEKLDFFFRGETVKEVDQIHE
ncbi:MAG TPA: hypothetical protein VJ044_03510, partial [Candidatus Hodarchaeales archaeon]|nr:hypothetical protein [Candidatus Hodarchaeales archaeon]